MTRPLSFVLALIVGVPDVLTAAPTVGAPHLLLTELSLSPPANTRIGIDESGRIIAVVTDDDGQIIEIGLATFDQNDMFVFAVAKLVHDDGELLVQQVKSGGVLMSNDKVLKIDPLALALKLSKAGLGVPMSDMIAKIKGSAEDATLTFANKASDIGAGTAVVVTKVILGGKIFGIAKTTDITVVTALKKIGTTWLADGPMVHLDEDGGLIDVTPTKLAAFNFGIASTPARTPQSQTAQHAAVAAS